MDADTLTRLRLSDALPTDTATVAIVALTSPDPLSDTPSSSSSRQWMIVDLIDAEIQAEVELRLKALPWPNGTFQAVPLHTWQDVPQAPAPTSPAERLKALLTTPATLGEHLQLYHDASLGLRVLLDTLIQRIRTTSDVPTHGWSQETFELYHTLHTSFVSPAASSGGESAVHSAKQDGGSARVATPSMDETEVVVAETAAEATETVAETAAAKDILPPVPLEPESTVESEAVSVTAEQADHHQSAHDEERGVEEEQQPDTEDTPSLEAAPLKSDEPTAGYENTMEAAPQSYGATHPPATPPSLETDDTVHDDTEIVVDTALITLSTDTPDFENENETPMSDLSAVVSRSPKKQRKPKSVIMLTPAAAPASSTTGGEGGGGPDDVPSPPPSTTATFIVSTS